MFMRLIAPQQIRKKKCCSSSPKLIKYNLFDIPISLFVLWKFIFICKNMSFKMCELMKLPKVMTYTANLRQIMDNFTKILRSIIIKYKINVAQNFCIYCPPVCFNGHPLPQSDDAKY